MYQIEMMPEAIRQLGKLPEKVIAAALETIYVSIADNPYVVGKPLEHPFEGLRSARRGEYRVIYAVRSDAAVDDHEGTVSIYRVAHRRDAYRR